MKEINFKPHPKQHLAFEYLNDKVTKEVVFGGAASGGKSYLGCAWIIIMALMYPETRYIIGRSELKTLKETTLVTFYQVCKSFGLINGEDFTYNQHDNQILFHSNNSVILFKDLQYKPSDPEYDSLGSLEITAVFVDEIAQITKRCWEILLLRTRYKLDEYGLTPKILGTCNPTKNWVKINFYDPFIKGELPPHRIFIPSLYKDNPHSYSGYADSLNTTNDEATRRRYEGDWNYEEDTYALFTQDKVNEIFSGHDYTDGRYYISADIARLGKDSSVIMVWNGYSVVEYKRLSKTPTDFTSAIIKELMNKYKINKKDVIVDEDGIGGSVVDMIKCKGFIAQTTPFNKENYKNLKAQCYFKLANTKFSINVTGMIEGNMLEEYVSDELRAVKQKAVEGKLSINSKEEQKNIINRSPDFSDALMMRMYFSFKSSGFFYELTN